MFRLTQASTWETWENMGNLGKYFTLFHQAEYQFFLGLTIKKYEKNLVIIYQRSMVTKKSPTPHTPYFEET